MLKKRTIYGILTKENDYSENVIFLHDFRLDLHQNINDISNIPNLSAYKLLLLQNPISACSSMQCF